MSDERASLQAQLANAEENLRLLRERKSEYVLESEIPLPLIRDERRLEKRIHELRAELGPLGALSRFGQAIRRRARFAAGTLLLVGIGIVFALPFEWMGITPGAQFLSPTPTAATAPQQPTATPTQWLYPIRVVEKDSEGAIPIPGARVVIETTSGAPLDSLTDSDGFTRVFIPSVHQGARAILRVTAAQHQSYRQELDLYANGLPDTVELAPLDASQ